MDFENVNEIFHKFGLGGLIIAFIVFIIRLIIKTQWFANWWSKFTDKFIEFFMKGKVETPQEVSESAILNHDIFNYIDFWTYSKIPTFQFSSEYRTVIFKKYLTFFLKNYKRSLRDFVQSKEYQTMDQSELWKCILDLLNRIIMEYEKECDEWGIPKIVVMKMKSKNNDTIVLTIDIIEGIINSKFYESENNYLKMYSILNILLSILENTITNSVGVCDSINGQLRGLSVVENGRTYIEP